MKKIACIALVLSALGVTAVAAAISTAEANRLRDATTVLSDLRGTPDTGIPDELWERAACVIVIPSLKKAAFIVGGEYGRGVASCRAADGWSAPVFMEMQKGSWGAQIGGQSVDLVLLVMNRTGMNKLVKNKVSLGAGASVAAGPVGRDARASTDLKLNAEILSYSRTQGVFAGVNLAGGKLGPDEDSNTDAYGAGVTAEQILNNTQTPPAEAAGFMAALRANATTPAATSGQK